MSAAASKTKSKRLHDGEDAPSSKAKSARAAAPRKYGRLAVPLQVALDFDIPEHEAKDPYSNRFVKGNIVENWNELNSRFERVPGLRSVFARVLVFWKSALLNVDTDELESEQNDMGDLGDEINFGILHPFNWKDVTLVMEKMPIEAHAPKFPGGLRGLCVLFSAVTNFGRVIDQDPKGVEAPAGRTIHPADVRPEDKLDIGVLAQSLYDFQANVAFEDKERRVERRVILACICTVLARHAFGPRRTIEYTWELLRVHAQPCVFSYEAAALMADQSYVSTMDWAPKFGDDDKSAVLNSFCTKSLVVEGFRGDPEEDCEDEGYQVTKK